jgi:hypothetical protein
MSTTDYRLLRKKIKGAIHEDLHDLSDSIDETDTALIINGGFSLDDDLRFSQADGFDKEIIFDGGTFNNIIFTGGYYKKIIFRRGTFNGYISIRGGTFDNIVLLGGTFNHWLGTLNGIINEKNGEKLAEERLKIRLFEIEGGTYTNNIWVSGGIIERLELRVLSNIKIHIKPNDDKIYDPVTATYSPEYDSIPSIIDLIFSRYSNKDSIFQISTIPISNIIFRDYINAGIVNFANIGLTENLEFTNSDLGKTTFINCDFFYRKLLFRSSKITEVALAGSRFPQPGNIISGRSDDSVKQRRLAFSQIKKVFETRGDNIEAGKYQAEELNVYYSELKFGWEKINLGFNKYSNNHGQSWERPLILLILSGVLFYTIFCLSLGVTFDFSLTGLKEFGRLACYFFEFINPIRKSDFLPKEILQPAGEPNIPALAFLVDNVSKIFTAYLVYQLIAAFRKHGKKSAS